MKNISGKFVKENQNTLHFKKTFPRKAYRLWDNGKNKLQPYRRQLTVRIIRWKGFACWIITTDTHSEYVILSFFFFFTATVVMRTRLNVALDFYCLSCSLPPVQTQTGPTLTRKLSRRTSRAVVRHKFKDIHLSNTLWIKYQSAAMLTSFAKDNKNWFPLNVK